MDLLQRELPRLFELDNWGEARIWKLLTSVFDGEAGVFASSFDTIWLVTSSSVATKRLPYYISTQSQRCCICPKLTISPSGNLHAAEMACRLPLLGWNALASLLYVQNTGPTYNTSCTRCRIS